MYIPMVPIRKQEKKVENIIHLFFCLIFNCNFVLQMGKNIIYYILGIAGVWYLLKKSFAAGAIKYNFTGIDFKKRAVEVELINPTPTPLQFSSIVSDISLNGSNVGIVDYRQPTILQGNQAIKIKLPIKVNAAGVLAFISSGINKIKTIGFEGTITAQGTPIPFNTTLTLNG